MVIITQENAFINVVIKVISTVEPPKIYTSQY